MISISYLGAQQYILGKKDATSNSSNPSAIARSSISRHLNNKCAHPEALRRPSKHVEMDQDQTPAPPAQTKLDVPMPDNPPKYVPQFSAATEMILKRINSGASVSNLAAISSSGPTVAYTGGSAKYEDMRRSVLMGMKTSMNMEMPATPISQKTKVQRAAKAKGSPSTPGATPSSASGSASGKGKGKGKGRGRAGGKRKRAQDEESLSEEEESEGEMSQLGGDSEDDDGGSVTSLPKITQSGRQVNKPTSYVPSSYEAPPKKRVAQAKRTQEQALCKRCGRGNSPEKNMIVFCDGCNLCWHQNCHDPVITEETVKDEVAPWFCSDCSRKRNVKTPASEQRGVSWQGRSSEEVRNLFISLTPQRFLKIQSSHPMTSIRCSLPNPARFPETQLFQFFAASTARFLTYADYDPFPTCTHIPSKLTTHTAIEICTITVKCAILSVKSAISSLIGWSVRAIRIESKSIDEFHP